MIYLQLFHLEKLYGLPTGAHDLFLGGKGPGERDDELAMWRARTVLRYMQGYGQVRR